jgi:hypothetical protein
LEYVTRQPQPLEGLQLQTLETMFVPLEKPATSSKDDCGYNILAADKLMRAPRLYATFLLWMLTELSAHLPEVGDLDTPKLVFFFDEAHLLFTDAPKNLLTAIEQVVRLLRPKGVGVYFVTQNPLDVPDSVLGQLGNRIQHALRTPQNHRTGVS